MERHPRTRTLSDIPRSCRLRGLARRSLGGGTRTQSRHLRAWRDDSDHESAASTVSHVQQPDEYRVHCQVDVPFAAAHARQADEQALLDPEQLHVVEKHGPCERGEADRGDADQPVRSGIRLGTVERGSAAPVRFVVPVAIARSVRQSGDGRGAWWVVVHGNPVDAERRRFHRDEWSGQRSIRHRRTTC